MIKHTIVKICGITNLEQAQECIELGADWIGFNCFPKSPRYIEPQKIKKIISNLPADFTSVGVFVNESVDFVRKIAGETGLNLAQLHGDESLEYSKMLNIPHFKAFRVSPDFDLCTIAEFPNKYYLLDSYHPHLYGGTGDPFNWEIAGKAAYLGNLILAGGLNPENVADAISTVKPFGVDVCSGVESCPGIKDLHRVNAFIQNVRLAEKNNV